MLRRNVSHTGQEPVSLLLCHSPSWSLSPWSAVFLLLFDFFVVFVTLVWRLPLLSAAATTYCLPASSHLVHWRVLLLYSSNYVSCPTTRNLCLSTCHRFFVQWSLPCCMYRVCQLVVALPLVTPLPPLVLSKCRLRLLTHRRLLSDGASHPVCLPFPGWLSHCSRRAASPSRPLDALLTFEAQWLLVL